MFTSKSSEAQNSLLLQHLAKLKLDVTSKIIENNFEVLQTEGIFKELLNHKEKVYKDINQYFDRAWEILKQRCNQLKDEYEKLEDPEIRR